MTIFKNTDKMLHTYEIDFIIMMIWHLITIFERSICNNQHTIELKKFKL